MRLQQVLLALDKAEARADGGGAGKLVVACRYCANRTCRQFGAFAGADFPALAAVIGQLGAVLVVGFGLNFNCRLSSCYSPSAHRFC